MWWRCWTKGNNTHQIQLETNTQKRKLATDTQQRQLVTNTHQSQLATMCPKRTTPLHQSNKWWKKATLLLSNKCTMARTTVLYCCAIAAYGSGAWGIGTRRRQATPTKDNWQQCIQKGQLYCNKATSDGRKQPCSSTRNVQWQELLSYTTVQ